MYAYGPPPKAFDDYKRDFTPNPLSDQRRNELVKGWDDSDDPDKWEKQLQTNVEDAFSKSPAPRPC